MPALFSAYLHHLQIYSPDPAALAAFYGRAMGMKVDLRGDQWICQAQQRRQIFAMGPPGVLGFAAYALHSPEALRALEHRLEAFGAAFERVGSPLFEAGALTAIDPDGNRIVFGIPLKDKGAEAVLPARLQHVVIATTDIARMSDFFQNVIGFRLSDKVIEGADDLRTVFLRSDHEHHSLAIFQASECRLDHHCYEASDWNSIRDWADHFASIRLPVEWGPGRHGPGHNLFIFVHDPDGNWIEISAELEVVTPDRAVGTWPHEERTLNSWGRGVLRS